MVNGFREMDARGLLLMNLLILHRTRKVHNQSPTQLLRLVFADLQTHELR